MDAELKAKWIEALRSGEFKQGKGALRERNSYCCLGVLCVVAGLTFSKDGYAVVVDDKDSGYEPLRKLGIEDMGDLWCRNDSGAPFTEIADYIEANL